MRFAKTSAAAVASMLVLVACSETQSPTGPLDNQSDPAFSHTGLGGEPGHIELCKVGSAANFDITIEDPTTALSPDVSLTNEPFADGECRVLYDVPLIVGSPSPNVDYTITEIVPAGVALDSIVREFFNAGTRTTLTGTNTDTNFANDDQGVVLTFFNRVLPPPPGGEGCTPGYWKNHTSIKNNDAWLGTGLAIGDSYDATFGVSSSFGGTLLEALQRGGGGEKALGRHATAALLNSLNGGVSYAYTDADVIAIVQNAYATGEFNDAKNLLAAENELGCPL